MKVYELLDKPEKLCKDAIAINKNGKIVNYDSPDAYAWCLIGAIGKCYGKYELDEIFEKIRDRLPDRLIITYVKENSYESIIKLLKNLEI